MSEIALPRTKSPSTPDERAHCTESNDPMKSIAKYDEGNTVWLSLPRQGSFAVTIVKREKDEETGEYVYQVKGKEGVLHNNGEWVKQEKLSEY